MPRRALPAMLALALAARAACAADAPRERGDYEIILERSPFGPPPPTAGLDAAPDGAAGAGAGSDAPAGPPTPAPVRLSSVTRYEGVPSAGLVELSSGRSFVLRPGEGWGPYRLLDALPEDGAVLVAQGTNEWFVALSWAKGQATNLVPSARAPYLTTFRPNAPKAEDSLAANAGSGADTGGREGADGDGSASPSGTMAGAGRRGPARAAAGLTEEEEAEIVRRATVTDPDGSTHVSFRELNRLRVEARRRKAEAARAEALAAAEALRAERKAAEEEAAAEKAEAERAHRAAVVAALAQGYDVEVDFELNEEEAAQLKAAGFDVPEEDDE